MTSSEQSDGVRRIMATQEKTCVLCGRKGTRGFMTIDDYYVCRSAAACERRERGTGSVGVGVMRNYRT